MALWLVTHAGGGATLRGGDTMIVSATDAGDAKAIAASQFTGDSGGWLSATATELTEEAVTASGALTGWVFTITIYTTVPKVFTLTGDATDDTLDEVGAALATLINLDADISGASYTGATQVLIVALGTGTDDLGDETITCTVMPPAVTGDGGQINGPVNIPGFVASLTHEGSATDNLEVTFAADTLLVPAVKAVLSA